jgi:hypothetical protein
VGINLAVENFLAGEIVRACGRLKLEILFHLSKSNPVVVETERFEDKYQNIRPPSKTNMAGH